MTHTDPRVVIKQIDPELRKEFFSTWPEFVNLDWSKLNKKTKIDTLLECIQAQSDSIQREITHLLGLFSSLKTDQGLRVLLEEIYIRNLEHYIQQLEQELRDINTTRPYDDVRDDLNRAKANLRQLKKGRGTWQISWWKPW